MGSSSGYPWPLLGYTTPLLLLARRPLLRSREVTHDTKSRGREVGTSSSATEHLVLRGVATAAPVVGGSNYAGRAGVSER